jgi:D-tyrosyl-tRNA(Tyr) deacylase
LRAVVQRVASASVDVDGRVVSRIGGGVVVLLGVSVDDSTADARRLAGKVAELRIFLDDDGKMNRSLIESGGAALVVSQFTLYGDARKGRRPSFVRAAQPEVAEPLYEEFVSELLSRGIACGTGEFGATMQVALVNDGPVTILLDTEKTF